MGHAADVSPLAPKTFVDAPLLAGVRMATVQAGIRYQGRTDVMLMAFDEGTTVAGVLTRSKCPSAAVDWCRRHLSQGRARALLVNSGNANAFTGHVGAAAVQQSVQVVSKALGVSPEEVFVASTGVIGEPLDARKFEPVMPALVQNLQPTGWLEAARAIMTTDTFPKLLTREVSWGDAKIRITGIAKGAGMIAPDMATMLSFLVTDAPVAADVLQALLSKHVKTTFNAMTIDGDTSTSDTLLLFATGAAKTDPVYSLKDPRVASFSKALKSLMADLAELVVRDGEGARKLIRITVQGAVSARSAGRVAHAIANSPLVKTAVAGEDANWGRVVMAVGKAGEPAERDLLSIHFNGVRVAHLGLRDPAYDEAIVSALMKEPVISIGVDLGLGRGRAEVKTCDLTKEYVAINGDYRS